MRRSLRRGGAGVEKCWEKESYFKLTNETVRFMPFDLGVMQGARSDRVITHVVKVIFSHSTKDTPTIMDVHFIGPQVSRVVVIGVNGVSKSIGHENVGW